MGSVGPDSAEPKRRSAPPPTKKSFYVLAVNKIEASPSLRILHIFGLSKFFANLNGSSLCFKKPWTWIRNHNTRVSTALK
jgi:hypothetical protein